MIWFLLFIALVVCSVIGWIFFVIKLGWYALLLLLGCVLLAVLETKKK